MAAMTIKHLGVRARNRVAGALIAAQLAFWGAAAAVAAPLESRPVGNGFDLPVFVTAPTGDNRLFVVEKGGQIKIMSGGSVLPTPFLSISVLNDGESGLLGMAFDPNFAASNPMTPGYRTFYVNYIHPTSGNTVVASYRVSDNPNVADVATATTILTVAQPAGQSNHKAGWIGFRPDEPNNLYIATGDGGGSNDPENRAQNLNDNLGKILRVNVRSDGFPADPVRNYSIPTDNPFVGRAGNDEIWAYGLRNPYRNSFDRLTGDFYIADVGQGAREELNFENADADPIGGANYGWRALEGTIENPGRATDPNPSNATPPILDYGRSFGSTIIGGYVARGGNLGELEGAYLFADYGSGRIWAIRYDDSFIAISQALDVTDIFNRDPSTGERLISGLASFGEDGFGRLYLVGYDGTIYAMVPEPATWAMLLAALLPGIWIARRRAVPAA
jgi:glucose/arabinose dehydrogenase